jgi:hypothetical protein
LSGFCITLSAYLSYRGSIVAATHYAAAIDVMVNLNRFALYQQLHLPVPANGAEEKAMNEALAEVLEHKPIVMR